MRESDFEIAERWQVLLAAVVCGAFSLPWFYILVVSIFTMVRDRNPPAAEVVYVLAAVAAAASIFSYFSVRLARGNRGRKNLLSPGFLWCWSVVSMLFAGLGLTARPPLVQATLYFGTMAVGAALLARSRRAVSSPAK